MIVKFNLSLFKEILWWLIGLFPLLFVITFMVGYYGPQGLKLFLEPTLEIQLHDTYIVIDTWMFLSVLVAVPLGLSLTLKTIFSRFKPKWLLYAGMILLLVADYVLFTFYQMYLQMYSLPIVQNANPTPWIFWLLLICGIATLIVLGMIVKQLVNRQS